MDIHEKRSIEYIKCKQNPLYFLYNYVYIPETGGKVLYGNVLHPKLVRVVRAVYRYKRVVFMASRQLGKSTISAALILWAMVFFPGIKCVILNYRKEPALENIDKIKFMWDNLPSWLKIPSPSQTFSRKTYFELKNGSRVVVLYPSTTHKPNTMARSLTVPILYIDEAAYIPHLQEIYGAAQQILSTARQQAIKHGYPYFQIVTSTPNGVYAPEANDRPNWFYDRWMKAIESDDIFIPQDNLSKPEILKPDEEVNSLLSHPDYNGFIRIRYHWSEDPNKDEEWYKEQCRELSDQRMINQELDLLFIGSTSCIFDDDTLSLLVPQSPIDSVTTPYGTKLHLYDTFDPGDYYLIGVDTASSLKGAYDAIEIYQFSDFKQIGELQCKLGSLTQYGEIVDKVARFVKQQVGNRFILCIENNSIGKAVIEHLTMKVTDVDYIPFIYSDKKNELGISTTGTTKPLMAALLKERVEQNPRNFKSQLLLAQLATVERTNSGTLKISGYSDLFMASSFCAYVRQKRELEILPLINKSNEEIEKEFFNTVKQVASITNPHSFTKENRQDPSISKQDMIDIASLYDDNYVGVFPTDNSQSDFGGFLF